MTKQDIFRRNLIKAFFGLKSLIAVVLLIGMSFAHLEVIGSTQEDKSQLVMVVSFSVFVFAAMALVSAASNSRKEIIAVGITHDKGDIKDLDNTRFDFKESVEEFLDLVEKTHAQFGGQFQSSDIYSLKENVIRLISSNAKLNGNYQEEGIGNDTQKRKMKNILDRQAASVDAALESLKTFTGNLALIDVTGQKEAIDQEISFINQGLKEAIDEEGFNV